MDGRKGREGGSFTRSLIWVSDLFPTFADVQTGALQVRYYSRREGHGEGALKV